MQHGQLCRSEEVDQTQTQKFFVIYIYI